ncbi:ImmA/IrrE family metallo-endopeptidase [Curtobacterium sp. Csp1]|uniref:ImmA/IrrE family metallo-endopeptidase n=1 Tax=Curtobacterium sp. Csp1 TaxID=2495429 RepID=UPI001599E37A|nr:ImmA/IrrE family metallo-endopeptidase [Curtobacterium sp. Csp1]QKS18894.1 ImmA/IrrE family metallo-endopeptidase [Curtobacterium sp. Csp1]
MSINKAALARLAGDIRTETGLSPQDAFDPWEWSRRNGVKFVAIQSIPGAEEAVRYFTATRFGVWSAALVSDGVGHAVFYDDSRPRVRIMSDLTHEVAHVEAEHLLTPAWTSEDGKCGGGNREQEEEAAELAAAILVPKEQATLWALRGWPAESLARKYGVSDKLAEWRMNVSGGRIIANRTRNRRAR